MKTKDILLILVLFTISILTMAQELSYDIRLNQIGFLPNSIKMAAVVNTEQDSFKVMTSDLQTTVFVGQFLPSAYYSSSGEYVSLADFTMMTDTGEYVMVINDLGKSVPFQISADVFTDLSKASLKYYYFNRASTPVLSEFGGIWARDEGHPDTVVIVLPSAATVNRPAGTHISTPGGWYDAGDYNKYIVSSGGTVFTLLSAYETYSEFYDTLDLNIPESSNSIPDILDEALWNIKWMMTMQDEDGGVYNKTTDANFSGFIMPSEANATRYVTAKSTAATLDFGAVMAMTARIFRIYDPELADSALAKAEMAWQWAKNNPDIVFSNPSAEGEYPAVNTGEYSDSGFDDEFAWCAAELYITTKDSNYYKEINFEQSFGVPGWPVVGTLSLLSLVVNQDSLTDIADIDMIKNKLIDAVSGTKNNVSTSPYRIPGDFYYWSGNNAFGNWGMLFIQVFRLSGDASYFNAAVASLDYLLGKNASTYCYITGYGSKSPVHPHHRISGADGVTDPVPGMLVGGANSGDVADCGASSYPSTFSAKSYLDSECSYSTNEVAIGINAVLAFLTGAVQAEYLMNFTDSMPLFFSLSTNKIELTYKVGDDLQLVIESNTDWELEPSVDWITISETEGSKTTTVLVNSNTNNPGDSARTGIIYVYSQSVLADSIMVTQNGKRKSFRIEAEDYLDMSGIQTETTGDIDGNENVGFVDVSDWITYVLDITSAGIYDVIIRHAGWAGDFDVSMDEAFLKNITLPATADWQIWESYTTDIALTEGQHTMKLTFNSAGINLNWYQFDWKSSLDLFAPLSNDIRIYPNPAQNYIHIEFNEDNSLEEIIIVSVEGKILIHQNNTIESNVNIDVSDLKPGVYLVKACFATQIYIQKVIIY